MNISIFIIFFSFILQTILFQTFKIPSSSMEPNLKIGDFLISEKFIYGYSKFSIPSVINYMNFSLKTINFHNIKSGEIIIFSPINQNKQYYVKRIIGLPFNIVEIKNNNLFVNNKKIKRIFLGYSKINKEKKLVFREFLNDKKSYRIYMSYNVDLSFFPQSTLKYYIPNNHYFCLGDNRDNSMDSRFLNNLGLIEKKRIIGRAKILICPNCLLKKLKINNYYKI